MYYTGHSSAQVTITAAPPPGEQNECDWISLTGMCQNMSDQYMKCARAQLLHPDHTSVPFVCQYAVPGYFCQLISETYTLIHKFGHPQMCFAGSAFDKLLYDDYLYDYSSTVTIIIPAVHDVIALNEPRAAENPTKRPISPTVAAASISISAKRPCFKVLRVNDLNYIINNTQNVQFRLINLRFIQYNIYLY